MPFYHAGKPASAAARGATPALSDGLDTPTLMSDQRRVGGQEERGGGSKQTRVMRLSCVLPHTDPHTSQEQHPRKWSAAGRHRPWRAHEKSLYIRRSRCSARTWRRIHRTSRTPRPAKNLSLMQPAAAVRSRDNLLYVLSGPHAATSETSTDIQACKN